MNTRIATRRLEEIDAGEARSGDRILHLPKGEDLLRAKIPGGADDAGASGVERYGRDAFEWRLELDPAACRRRLARARDTFALWSAARPRLDRRSTP